MNPLDLSNAVLYGIPIVMYTGMHHRFESLLTRRGRAPQTKSDLSATITLPAAATTADGPELRLSVAKSPEELEVARDLVRKRYTWRGYEVGGFNDAAIPHAAPDCRQVTFVVVSSEAALGTLTLGLDGPAGLLAEGTADDVINNARASGRRVCELTRLAIIDNIHSKAVLASLFSLTHAVGRTTYGVTDAFIEVNPRHVAFYSRVFGFVVAASEKFCERVRAPSVLLRLELDALEERLERLGMGELFAKAA